MRDDGLLGHDQKAGGVVSRVLDVGAQRDQAVDVAGQFRGDHRLALVSGGGDAGGGAGGIHRDHRLQAQFADQMAALVEGVDVAVHVGDVLDRRALDAEQVVVHPLVVLADDVQARLRKQVVDVGDASGHRVLDGDHPERRPALGDRREGVLEGAARQGLHLRPRGPAGEVRIGSRLTLEGDGPIRIRHADNP